MASDRAAAAAMVRIMVIPLPFTDSVEQSVLRRLGLGQAEMGPRLAVEAAAASGAGDQAQLDEEGLDHLLDRVARLREAGGESLDPHRAALVEIGDHHEVAPVHRIKAELVDLHSSEGGVGDL